MNRGNLLFSVLLAFLVLGTAFFLYKKHQKVFSLDNIVQLRIDTDLIDLGVNKQHSSIIARYVIHNISKKLLVVESVKPDCFCTTPSFDKKKVAPSDSVIVSLKYTSEDIGFFQTTATVYTNAKQSPTILTYRGRVIP